MRGREKGEQGRINGETGKEREAGGGGKEKG